METKALLEERTGNGEEDGFDAIVVGSGYGGSVAACRMSMAGIKVCLLEKGRRWNAEDFPTNTLQIMSALRLDNRNLGLSFGPKDALFQVYQQNDSLAAVACGLGGGSLVNAGVMLPTPATARKHSKWPKEWERDWEVCQASAAAMLRIQTIPVKFPIARVMDEIAEGDTEETLNSLIKLSMNFDVEELPSKSMKLQQMNSCLACGNCISGCPYDAKSSTDKNYLLSAIQAGCTVRTECQAQYVIENTPDLFQQARISGKQRRWRVYLNEIDYLASDFVILSAGVFGTTQMLFRSQLRGLRLSEALGSGFSCNGNTVAYLAGSTAPLNGYGLDREQVPTIPFQERPGPSISSSYTSSLGFTIQSAVLPRAYPYLLFKGITTYGWPTGTGYSFLYGIIDKLRHIIGLKSTQAIVLNAMGYDEGDGKITFDKGSEKICFDPPYDPMLPRKIEAYQKLTKKLGGTLFMSRYRSTAVHLLGGSNASLDSSGGVCNHKGQVFDPKTPGSVYAGLYVCDASLIPCSVGINPSLTIATVAEHASRNLAQDILEYKNKRSIHSRILTGSRYSSVIADKNLDKDSSILIKETMIGYVGGMPCAAYLKLRMNSQNQKGLNGLNPHTGESYPVLRGKVGGYLVFKALEKDKIHIIDGEVDMCLIDHRTPYTQHMHYHLLLVASSGSKYILEGKKIMNPYLFGLYAWKETTTLHVTFKKLTVNIARERSVNLRGELRVSFTELLKSFLSLKGKNAGRFIYVLLQTFVRTYFLQIPRGFLKDLNQNDSFHKSYPDCNLHTIKTEDGFAISCRQWKCTQNQWGIKGEKQPNPVLLLNGYSTESYVLPTEPHDVVRTLLREGHEIWVLQTRLHPMNPANSFTIDDIGKYDIPAAINKILELHGLRTTIHVIAHCVGGLAIHIALMGGHVNASTIASLTCTNSSMFFKLTTLPRVKMWLPLVPITTVLLGKKKILPLLEASKSSFRHRLLKGIARCIPRYERCTCKECEVFSGIFGNTFWHENVSPTMHQWLNKHSSTKLPMGGFHHLRKICNSGFIGDSNGDNSYLIHPERMGVSTLYISGGRSLLVTPETSFLANKYMMLHQPGFRHERFVVQGFGHSDLLIGEKSYEEVFPHFLSHIKRAELEQSTSFQRKKCSKEVLDWGDDPHQVYAGYESWFSLLAVILLVLLIWLVLFSV